MKAAIRDNDPVMFMENTLLYGENWEVPEPGEGEFIIPLGVADLKREGTDVSLIAHGRAVLTALKAAETLSAEHGIECEVLDLRSIRPLDEDAILETVAQNQPRGPRRREQTVLRRQRPDRRHDPGKCVR